jgi:hypothetical protein
VPVQRGRESGRVDELGDREPAARLRTGGLESHQVAEEPQCFAFAVPADHGAVHVAAFGSKAALLRELLDEALAGDDEPVPVAEREWFQPVWEATTPSAVLDAYAGVCVLIAARAARLFEVVHRAADDSAEVAQLWQSLQDNRRAGARMVLEHALTVGQLADRLTLERAIDTLWILNDPPTTRRWCSAAAGRRPTSNAGSPQPCGEPCSDISDISEAVNPFAVSWGTG